MLMYPFAYIKICKPLTASEILLSLLLYEMRKSVNDGAYDINQLIPHNRHASYLSTYLCSTTVNDNGDFVIDTILLRHSQVTNDFIIKQPHGQRGDHPLYLQLFTLSYIEEEKAGDYSRHTLILHSKRSPARYTPTHPPGIIRSSSSFDTIVGGSLTLQRAAIVAIRHASNKLPS